MKTPLHPSYERALQVICMFYELNHYYPSHSELARELGVCRSMVNKYIRRLEERGLIERNRHKHIINAFLPPSYHERRRNQSNP